MQKLGAGFSEDHEANEKLNPTISQQRLEKGLEAMKTSNTVMNQVNKLKCSTVRKKLHKAADEEVRILKSLFSEKMRGDRTSQKEFAAESSGGK
jgi:hypothetical protein